MTLKAADKSERAVGSPGSRRALGSGGLSLGSGGLSGRLTSSKIVSSSATFESKCSFEACSIATLSCALSSSDCNTVRCCRSRPIKSAAIFSCCCRASAIWAFEYTHRSINITLFVSIDKRDTPEYANKENAFLLISREREWAALVMTGGNGAIHHFRV